MAQKILKHLISTTLSNCNVGQGICGHVAKTGVGEIIPDTSKDDRYKVDDSIRYSEITVPIISDGKVIGVIDSEHPDKDFYTSMDLEILKTIASMVSVKIDQARAQEKIRKHKEELEMRVAESTLELQNTVDQLKESNEQILQSNKEKETLLKEIHHRVKNNLQIVSSLLNMHANNSVKKVDEEVFRDCQNRILSMSIIHEQLYNKGNLAEIDTKRYIEEISQGLFKSYDVEGIINLELDLDQVYFDIQKSVPFGLILNELVVNSIKHAFPENSGTIKIALKETGKEAILKVEDNGCGYDAKNREPSMGLDLIETLVSQVDGDFSVESTQEGTKNKLSFSKL